MSPLTPVQFGDPSNPIRVEFFLAKPPPTRLGDVLVMKFSGEYRVGCRGNPDAAFICAMQRAAVEYWDPEGAVLDLRDLDYAWGDMMDAVRGSPLPRWRSGAHAVVVGKLSSRAMATLMFGVETDRPVTDAAGYFDGDLDAALAYVFDRLPREATDTLHLRPPSRWPRSVDEQAVTDEAAWLASRDPGPLLRRAVWRAPPPTPEQLRALDEPEPQPEPEPDARQVIDAIFRPAAVDLEDWSAITPDTERRMLLLAVACLRRIEPAMTDARTRRAVDVAERFADGGATHAEFAAAKEAAHQAYFELYRHESDAPLPRTQSGRVRSLSAALAPVWLDSPEQALSEAVNSRPRLLRDKERAEQADLVRDIFPNPFRPLLALDPRCRTPGVVALARAIYDARDFARLPALADALERAGCVEVDIVAHLRHPGPHVRGCYVLDLLLFGGS